MNALDSSNNSTDQADIQAVMEAIIPADFKGHIIEVARLGCDFSVTHTCNGKLLYTSTYEKEFDALRIAALMGASIDRGGLEVCLNIKTHLMQPL